MEHGSGDTLPTAQVSEYMKNGVVSPIMANFSDGPISQEKEDKVPIEPDKLNGENCQDYDAVQDNREDNPFEDSYSSESDALVIDESVPKKKKVRRKYSKKPKEVFKCISEKGNDNELSTRLSTSSDSRDITSEKQSNIEPKVEPTIQPITDNSLNSDLLQTNESLIQPNEIPNDVQSFSSNIIAEDLQTKVQNCDQLTLPNSEILEQPELEPNEPFVSETHAHCDISRLNSDLSNNTEVISHSNPYFNESIFELSQLHHNSNETTCVTDALSGNKNFKRAKGKPKFKEYAQYLGLQPAIQFKCPRCGRTGFESLLTLQEHFQQCTSVRSLQKSTGNENVSGFKLTRRVFLCSACGTYYENWNLYMHMLEYHKRYICLYCLGMFSVLNDLCQHIQSRHNQEPGIKDTLEDFLKVYNEPCYIVCCECNQQFNESDNFFYHKCLPSKATLKSKPKLIKSIIAPENHVTGDSVPSEINEAITDCIETTVRETDMQEDSKEADLQISETPDGKQDMGNNNLAESGTINNHVPEDLPETIFSDVNNEKQNFEDLVANNTDSDQSDNDSEVCDYSANPIESEHFKNIENMEEPLKEPSISNFGNIFAKESTCQQNLYLSKISDDNFEEEEPVEDTIEDPEENVSEADKSEVINSEPIETRKVPKLSLKLPKPGSYPEPDADDSDYSDKLDMEGDNSENGNDHTSRDPCEDPSLEQGEQENREHEEIEEKQNTPQYPVAGPDVPIIEIELDQPLDKMDIKLLLKKCLRSTVPTCIYCNHSRKIAINGRQLGLHAMAEHRYSAINKSITEEELIPESFNIRIKECLDELETVFFNLDSAASEEAVTFSHVFECFQCHYSTTVHKELYLHNRKFHSKNLLLCIMCKSNFYSYSELICHLCPGVYVLDYDLHFRCCMCVSDDLPSSFRLMVHLRKRHNVCDVCLEMCQSQYKLSNHVWKHKLHHFCYRCGIAYRNKPDITRHLFWKHGTESVLCKKCLQKKWPHVYHFCVPPTSFVCEECNLMFTRAVSLKVHKRLHSDEKKHACTWEDCTESFISKKLMQKHLKRHTEPPEDIKVEEIKEEDLGIKEEEAVNESKENEEIIQEEEPQKPVKPKVDVYDLPELNLSESDSSDSESEAEKPKLEDNSNSQLSAEDPNEKLPDEIIAPMDDSTLDNQPTIMETSELLEIQEQPPVDDTSCSLIQDIWDNFKNYQANKEKMDNMLIGEVDIKVDKPYIPDIPIPEVEEGISWQLALRDHDYCLDPEKSQAPDTIIEVKPSLESTESMDHDYCFNKEKGKGDTTEPVSAVPPPPDPPSQQNLKNSPARKRTSSSSSSSSDSDSSCACGSSCSCSDSSSGSSSSSSESSNSDSSTEEGRKRQQQRRLKRKERIKSAKNPVERPAELENKVDVATVDHPAVVIEMPIHESDLDTTESETDEEFYDREPQKFARKILEEKRAQLLAEMGPNMVPNGSFIESTSRPPTPPAGTVEEEREQPKRKKKTKKRKKRKSDKKVTVEERTYSSTLIMDSEPVIPPPSVPYYQQFHHQIEIQSPTVAPITLSLSRNSPARTPRTPPISTLSTEKPTLIRQESATSDTSVRASKRRRVPNKFYGYSSDEDAEKSHHPKRPKIEVNRTIPAPPSPMLVPPITIKNVSSPTIVPPRPQIVEPITLRIPKPHNLVSDYKSHKRPPIPPIRLSAPRYSLPLPREDSATESNDSDLDEPPSQPPLIMTEPPKPPQPQLYCYCRCPYDEVSEMIGCDSNDCQIEWFHFECVGIMVPPKGQWFCPDCRKKKQQQRGLL